MNLNKKFETCVFKKKTIGANRVKPDKLASKYVYYIVYRSRKKNDCIL